MTTKRDMKGQPKATNRPRLKMETLKDLDAKGQGEGVKAGAYTGECKTSGDGGTSGTQGFR